MFIFEKYQKIKSIINSVFTRETDGPIIIDTGYEEIKIKNILFLSIDIN